MKSLFSLIALSFTLAAFAFDKGMPEGAQYHLEQNQEQVAQQQALQGRMAPLGDTPIDTEMMRRNPDQKPDATAKRTLALVQEREQSRNNILAAQERMKAQQESAKKGADWPKYLVVLLVVAALLVIGKKYLDQSTPNMPKKRKVSW